MKKLKNKIKLALEIISGYFFNNWITFCPIHFIRIIYLKKILGLEIGNNTFIHLGCNFNGKVTIGSNTVVGKGCRLLGIIKVGDNVAVGAETYIISGSHNKENFEFFDKAVYIYDHVWIGVRAVIFPGATIGMGAIISASSSVVGHVGELEIHRGNPAIKIGMRKNNISYVLNYSPYLS